MGNIRKKYSLFSNIRFMLSMLWDSYKAAVFFSFLLIFAGVATPYLGMLLPKIVVDALEAGVGTKEFLFTVGNVGLLCAVFQCLTRVCYDKVGYSMNAVLGIAAVQKIAEKNLDIDYELSEHPDVRKLQAQAQEMSWGAGADGTNLIKHMSYSAMNLLGLIVYGLVIVSIHPIIAILLCAGVLINIYMLKKARDYEENNREEMNIFWSKLGYLAEFSAEAASGKDIRMYSMFGWLKELKDIYMQGALGIYESVTKKQRTVMFMDGLIILIRDGAAYAYLIYLVLHNQITLGEFLLVFAAIGRFAGWVSELIQSVHHLLLGSIQVSDFQSFCSLEDNMNRGVGVPLPAKEEQIGFLFEGVSYTYPGAQKPTLEKMNLQIKPGEKLAVVGMNGAGKTTFIKLLCGLYTPTEGNIFAAGHNVKEYNRDEYYSLFSAVFQDIHLITDTIAGNVSQQHKEDRDMEKVKECLKRSGLYPKVETLPKKEDTLLVKSVNEDAVEFSGGELQKLALSRALYKDAPVLILDEPTAALDPIAESEIYNQYLEMTKGRSAVFISHRLASTRFCDRILLLEDGKILEEGTHEQLIAKGGRYSEMFDVQASYYQENKEGGAK